LALILLSNVAINSGSGTQEVKALDQDADIPAMQDTPVETEEPAATIPTEDSEE